MRDDPHAVRDNRARLLGALGLDPQTVAYATQVHGATCLTPKGPGWSGTGDALVTRRSDLTLAVGTADCMGILAWDAIGSAAAAVHAGWRGMVAGAVTVALDALLAQGVPAVRLRVALGPRIGPCCFLVGPEVAEQFAADEVRSEGRRITVDLARAAQRQIARAGVRQDAVFDAAEVLPRGRLHVVQRRPVLLPPPRPGHHGALVGRRVAPRSPRRDGDRTASLTSRSPRVQALARP